MKKIQDALLHAVSEIIHRELNETEQQLFAIEGKEMVASLFEPPGIPSYTEEDGLVFDFGIAPSPMELQAEGVSFSDVIRGCFYILKNVSSRPPGKGLHIDDDDGDHFRTILKNGGTNPLLTDLLCEKYKTLLTDLIVYE